MDASPYEIVLDSLQRRVRAMHSLWYDAVASMDIDQVNHFEGGVTLPIAFSLFHLAQIEDGALLMLASEAPLWDETWSERLKLAIPDHGKHRSVEEMVGQRIGDYEAFCEYQRAVFDRTEQWLSKVDPASLGELIVPKPYPPMIASTFSARVGGEAGITRHDGIECWVYQHGLRHMGEVEHARALVGLGGMTS